MESPASPRSGSEKTGPGSSIAVVGGGPSGLAAAWRLSRGGHRVRIYEAAARPGGRLRTEAVAGRGADAVVQLLSTGYTETRELVAAMGLADLLVPVPGRDALWRGGVAHGLTYGSVASMVASGALPTLLKMRMGMRYLPFLERHRGSLDLNEPTRAAEAGLDRVSIAEWGLEELGEDFVELLAYPLLAAYYGVAPEETSAAFFHALARAGMGVEVLGVRGGFGELGSGMARVVADGGVEVVTGSRVRGIEPAADGARLRVDDQAGETRVFEHRAVVLAVPAPTAASLWPGVPLLDQLMTRSSATLVLSLGTRLETGWFGLSIPRREPGADVLAAVCVQSEKGTAVVGGAGDTLVLIPTPTVGERWADSAPAVALEEGLRALRRVLPRAAAAVEEARLIRLSDGVWIPAPGHFERVAAFRHDSLPPWLAIAGDFMVAPTVEGAVRSGLAAADRIAITASGT